MCVGLSSFVKLVQIILHYVILQNKHQHKLYRLCVFLSMASNWTGEKTPVLTSYLPEDTKNTVSAGSKLKVQ